VKLIEISLTLLVLIRFVVGISVIAVYAKNHRNKAHFFGAHQQFYVNQEVYL
jgi:hypothetical protein